ncbi:unnamed protein product [Blepharisma stoltei]|uniref:Tetratricopeptide repeat protein n=1 Tax=Blepharisma stoltei TaxID=1481888 RepID=A0AAU9JR84_9CILI|nr:unnamed protein product [Blepharisma stoltei]
MILINEKRYEEAINYFDNAIRIQKKALYYINKGNALKELSRSHEAIGCYDEAIRIDPEEASAFNGIGIILDNEKRYEEANLYYNRALECKPKNSKKSSEKYMH